jgi:hypothetical protein
MREHSGNPLFSPRALETRFRKQNPATTALGRVTGFVYVPNEKLGQVIIVIYDQIESLHFNEIINPKTQGKIYPIVTNKIMLDLPSDLGNMEYVEGYYPKQL